MSIPEKVFDKYFSLEARLASFQKAQPIIKTSRASSHARLPKTMTWPHKFLAPEDLARAGFFYYPLQSNLDNAVCFLCRKSMDGWEQGDEPHVEHITHSANCGWAVVTAIEVDYEDFATQDPSSAAMVDARGATFSNKWPHEHLPNWKCQTKQLVDAGWKYTPCPGSDDMATCVYCDLALDGWEPDDDPMFEHLSRSTECAYFQLLKYYGAKSKKTKGKARASKHTAGASNHSTLAADPSMMDETAEVDDSVVTTASAAAKKGSRKKTATAAKGRKTRAKKDETIEIQEAEDETNAELPKAALKKRTTRGRPKADESSIMASQTDISIAASTRSRGKKRTSDAMEDSAMAEVEAPASKKRATRGGKSKVADDSLTEDAPAKKPARKGRAASGTKKPATRKTSATAKADPISSIPFPPPRLPTADLPDDAAIDRQLLADLDQPFSDDDDLHGDSDIERQKPGRAGNTHKSLTPAAEDTVMHHEVSRDYHIFDPTPQDMDEDELSAELDAMQVGNILQPKLPAKKSGRGSGAKPGNAHKAEAERKPEPEPVIEPHLHEDSIASTGTVIRNELSETSEEPSMDASVEASMRNGSLLKEEASRLSVASNATTGSQPAKRGRGRPPKKSRSLASRASRVSQPPATESPMPVAPIEPTEPDVAPNLPTHMELDVGEEDSFESARENVATTSIPGAFPGAFLEVPPITRHQTPKSPLRKPVSPVKNAPLPPLPSWESPVPSPRASPQIPRPVSLAKPKAAPAPSPFRHAVMSPFRAVQAAFSSPTRAAMTSPSKERLASPSKERLASPLKERLASPLKERLASPSKERLASPSKERLASPSKERLASPSKERLASPSKERLASPSKERLASPSKERLASPSKEPLIPAPPFTDSDSVHSPAKSALSRVLASSPSKDSLLSSPLRDVVSPRAHGVENIAPPSIIPLYDPFVTASVREPLISSVMREPVLTSPSRRDPLSPSDDDVIMSDGDPGTPTPVRHDPPRQFSPQNQQSPLRLPISRLALPTTPGHGPSPSASARQAVLSPSQSPQSSDAENRPPSSQPASVMSKRLILAPIPPKTPSRMSPSRRNILGTVQTTVPWSPIDLEKIFGSEREFEDRASAFFDPKDGKLSTPELRMTVEEWVAHRGKRAEELVKQECEQMVTDFEQKGMQALRAVEGLVVTEE